MPGPVTLNLPAGGRILMRLVGEWDDGDPIDLTGIAAELVRSGLEAPEATPEDGIALGEIELPDGATFLNEGQPIGSEEVGRALCSGVANALRAAVDRYDLDMSGTDAGVTDAGGTDSREAPR